MMIFSYEQSALKYIESGKDEVYLESLNKPSKVMVFLNSGL